MNKSSGILLGRWSCGARVGAPTVAPRRKYQTKRAASPLLYDKVPAPLPLTVDDVQWLVGRFPACNATKRD